MTDCAGLFILSRHEAMTLRPTDFVARRRRLSVHVHMTRGAIRSHPMRLVTNLKPDLAIHPGNQHQLLVH